MLIEVRQRRKVVGLAVLHHEERARLNHLRCQNLARNLAEVRQVVRRVNKNHVVLLRGGVDKLKHVALHERHIVHTEHITHLADEIKLHMVLLHSGHRGTFPREKLKADGARTAKEVESDCPLKVDEIFYHIKYVFSGEIGSRSRRDIARHVETTTAEFSSDYSHKASSIKW